MLLGRVRLQHGFIEIDNGRGAKRIQFGGFGGKGGGKERGDKQADQPVREMVENVGDENVIGVVALIVRIDEADEVKDAVLRRFRR